jgi:hypothetical protein
MASFFDQARKVKDELGQRIGTLPQQVQATSQLLSPYIQKGASHLSPTNYQTPVLGGVRQFNRQTFGPSVGEKLLTTGDTPQLAMKLFESFQSPGIGFRQSIQKVVPHDPPGAAGSRPEDHHRLTSGQAH